METGSSGSVACRFRQAVFQLPGGDAMTHIDSIIVLFWFVPVALQIILPLGMLLGYGLKRMFSAKTGSELATMEGAAKRLDPHGGA